MVSWTHLLWVFAHLNPQSCDFGYICALCSPCVHQLPVQSSLFEHGCPVSVVVCVARKLRLCPSYSRPGDHINLGLWRSLHKGGGVDVYVAWLPATTAQDHLLKPRRICFTVAGMRRSLTAPSQLFRHEQFQRSHTSGDEHGCPHGGTLLDGFARQPFAVCAVLRHSPRGCGPPKPCPKGIRAHIA